MKKLCVLAVSMAAVVFASCSGDVKADLQGDADSLAYDLGLSQVDGLKQYMTMQLGVDSADIDEFIKGMKEGALNEADKKKDAYLAGLQVGKQIQQMSKGLSQDVFADDSTKTINISNMLAGFIDGLKGNAPKTAQEAYADFTTRMSSMKYGKNKEEGKAFLEKNAKAAGVKTTASGLQYKVLTEGTGEKPVATDSVEVVYEGRFIDGTVFDATANHGRETDTFALSGNIQGWIEALQLMPVGSEWEVYIPSELAYGERGNMGVEPYKTLIFKIKLVSKKAGAIPSVQQ